MEANKKDIFNTFIYLGALLSLVPVLISLLVVVFSIINTLIIDDTESYRVFLFALEGTFPAFLSLLIVSFPLFVYFTGKTTGTPSNKLTGIIKTLRNVTVAFALTASVAILVIATAIFLTNFFTAGLTMRFFIKIIATLIIAFLIFFYYRKVWNEFWENNRGKEKKFGILVSALAILIIGISTYLINPLNARDRNITSERINYAGYLENDIEKYHSDNNRLPETFNDITPIFTSRMTEKRNIEYIKVSNSRFKLCFETKIEPRFKNHPNYKKENFRYSSVGVNCFDFSIVGNPNSMFSTANQIGEGKLKI